MMIPALIYALQQAEPNVTGKGWFQEIGWGTIGLIVFGLALLLALTFGRVIWELLKKPGRK